jgi:hypothetical protein
MRLEDMSKQELVDRIREMNEYMENVVVFWGGKKEFQETFSEVARNESGEYTTEEARDASILLENETAFEEFIRLVRDSFERGGINYVLSEKITALMQEAASRYAAEK